MNSFKKILLLRIVLLEDSNRFLFRVIHQIQANIHRSLEINAYGMRFVQKSRLKLKF